jgi:hypothetical protein
VRIDLERLGERHAELPVIVAKSLGFHAAVALERCHRPGVVLSAEVCGAEKRHALDWQPLDAAASVQVDPHRATEDGAEAVALALVHAEHGWVVRRRLQRRQCGDWLLEQRDGGRRVVFEVGGSNDGSLRAKLRGELAQVQRSPLPYDRAACVVRFADVRAMLVEVPHVAR